MDLLGKKRSTGLEGNGASTGTTRTYDPSCNLEDSISGKGNYAFSSGSSRDLDLNAGGSDLNCAGKNGLDLNYPVAANDDDGKVNLDHTVANIRAYIDLNVDVNDCGAFIEESNVKGHCFDLNLESGEENLELNEGLDLNHVSSKGGFNKLGNNRNETSVDNRKDVRDEGISNERKGDLNLELGEDINGVSKSVGCEDLVSSEVVERDAIGSNSLKGRRGRKKRTLSSEDTKAAPESDLRRGTRRCRDSSLSSKDESSESYQCEHCNKDVLIRDAVSCQYCKGFFHKRHVRKTSGSVTVPGSYTCHKCGADDRVLSAASRKIKKASKERNVAGGSKVAEGNKQSRKNQTDKNATVSEPARRSKKQTKTRSASLQAILKRTEPINGGQEENQGMEHEGNQ